MAQAAGISITWQDISDLSDIVPLLARVYPNGLADVNHFHAAGGMGFLIRELLDAGYLHDDVRPSGAKGCDATRSRRSWAGRLKSEREPAPDQRRRKVLATGRRSLPADRRAQGAGGQSRPRRHQGFGGEAGAARRRGAGPVFHSQEALNEAFKAGELTGDVVAVVRFQGPKANGMPELHKLTPVLGILQDRGFKVALVTDGRMSGASGKVPAAIHVTPEALDGGRSARSATAILIRLDAEAGTLEVLVVFAA
jgi:phosphogluconate dehydratase